MFMQNGKYPLFMLLVATLFIVSARTNLQATEEVYYENDILGVALAYSPGYQVIEHEYLSDAYGFILADDNKFPVLQVSWLHRDNPEEKSKQIEETITNFSTISISQEPIQVGGHEGVMLSPVPGIVAGTLIYVTANGRLYTLLYANGSLDGLGRLLIDSIRFYESHRSLEELQLIHQNDVLYIPPHLEEALKPPNSEKLPLPEDSSPIESSPDIPAPSSVEPGCDFWHHIVQTQWGSGGNGNGWSAAGPSFYGQGMHQRCNSSTHYNSYYALDHSLNEFNVIYPHKSGTVIFAGWAGGGWCTLGRMVIIDHGMGYWGVSAHLKHISSNAEVGNWVDTNTVIGFAGGSGCGSDNYFSVHLHQSVNKNAILSTNPGGIYGGQSARPLGYQHSGNGGGTYWHWNLYNTMPMSW